MSAHQVPPRHRPERSMFRPDLFCATEFFVTPCIPGQGWHPKASDVVTAAVSQVGAEVRYLQRAHQSSDLVRQVLMVCIAHQFSSKVMHTCVYVVEVACRVPSQCPQEIAEMIDQCCLQDPLARPTARELVTRLEALQTSGKAQNNSLGRCAKLHHFGDCSALCSSLERYTRVYESGGCGVCCWTHGFHCLSWALKGT